MIRFGIVGCGKVGGLHAGALATIADAATLAAVCDTSTERASAFAERHGARAFTSVREMAASGLVDAITVCTPHPLHAEAVCEAAAHGVHALVEKPMAASLADCDAMLNAARAAGTRLGVISQRRWYTPVLRMKAAIAPTQHDEGGAMKPTTAAIPGVASGPPKAAACSSISRRISSTCSVGWWATSPKSAATGPT